LTSRPSRAILRASMRRALLVLCAAVLCATTLAGCGNACQDLGDRLCSCVGAGTTRDTCKQQIKNQLEDVGLDGTNKGFCAQKLDSCNAPAGAQFCEWINTEAGKVACGLAFPDPAASLQSVP